MLVLFVIKFVVSVILGAGFLYVTFDSKGDFTDIIITLMCNLMIQIAIWS